MTDDLAAFVAARLDEQARRAEIARELREKLDDPYRVIDPGMRDGAEVAWRQISADPAFMLREVAAKRAILAEHQHVPMNGCRVCADGTRMVNGKHIVNPVYWPCPTVRALAAVYSDHPGYRPEWAPAPATLAP